MRIADIHFSLYPKKERLLQLERVGTRHFAESVLKSE